MAISRSSSVCTSTRWAWARPRSASSSPPRSPAAASVVYFSSLGLQGADAYRPLFGLYAVIGLANLAVFLTLSDRVELVKVDAERRFLGIRRSSGTVAKLSLLFGLDAFAGGFVVLSLVAYWFHLRWDLSPGALASLFFWVKDRKSTRLNSSHVAISYA